MDIVTLLEVLVKGLNEAEEKFFENPKDFYSLETSVKSSTEAFAASFLGMVISSINSQIYRDGWRQGKYKVQRNDTRTLITSVGDVTFDSTYYKSCDNKGEYHYLTEEVLGITAHERFSEAAEVTILTEAMKTSYEEATKVLPSKSKITKTTVMNKVHKLAEDMPEEKPEKLKKVKYLFIEADEDHVSEQHGRWRKKEENGNFISKLAYVYEYKQENPKCKGRKELVNTFYFGGVYEGSKGVEKFWNKVSDFVYCNYDEECIEKIYIIGDGASWIKSGVDYFINAAFCLDKFHLMKYINKASNQMLDESDIAKAEIYRLLHKQKKSELNKYLNTMLECANNPKPVQEAKTLIQWNWSAIMRTLHDENVKGCSAEGHVSHVLSDRLSSRPKGWSKEGADRISKLRCYERNHGRDKIIDLVRYSREKRQLARTGTEDVGIRKISYEGVRREHYDQAKGYIDRIQATMPGSTGKKIYEIREQIKLI